MPTKAKKTTNTKKVVEKENKDTSVENNASEKENKDTSVENNASEKENKDTSVEKPLLNKLEESFKTFSKALKNGTASITNQKIIFRTVKEVLDVIPAKVPDKLIELSEKYPNTVDDESLRFNHLWDDYDDRAAYNALISMLSIKNGVIEPYYMDTYILKSMLSRFGDNGYYLTTLYTEV